MSLSSKDIEFFNSEKTELLTINKRETSISIPVWGIVHNQAVYMATDSDSMKIKLIEHNPNASVIVMQDPPGFSWIRIEGKNRIWNDFKIYSVF